MVALSLQVAGDLARNISSRVGSREFDESRAEGIHVMINLADRLSDRHRRYRASLILRDDSCSPFSVTLFENRTNRAEDRGDWLSEQTLTNRRALRASRVQIEIVTTVDWEGKGLRGREAQARRMVKAVCRVPRSSE